MNKVTIGLVFENKETARAFVCTSSPYGKTVKDTEHEFVYETSIERFIWIKPFKGYIENKMSFVFTTEEIRDTEWFDTVIRPMQSVGTGAIDQIR